jgi:hypothetical protein
MYQWELVYRPCFGNAIYSNFFLPYYLLIVDFLFKH